MPKVLDAIHKAITSGKVLSCHDVSEGGLITSIFEMCVGGNCGAKISTSEVKEMSQKNHTSEVYQFLFAETAGCFLVEVDNEKTAKQLFKGLPFKVLGNTTKNEELEVSGLFKVSVERLEEAWKKPMKEIFS